MALLRTRRIAYHAVANVGNVEQFYECPSGVRTVVRDIRLANVSTAPASDVIVLVQPSGAPNDYWIFRGSVDAQATHGLVVDVVLHEGDTLGIFSSTPNVRIYVSGAVMPIPM